MNPLIDDLQLLMLENGMVFHSVAGDLIIYDRTKNVQLTKRVEDERVLTPAGESLLRELQAKAVVPNKLASKRPRF